MAGSNLAGVARVAFEAQTGEFNADIRRAEQVYHQTTGQMSDDAIRLSLAQDKLRRALDRFGPSSAAARRATLSLRSAERQAEEQTKQTTRAIDRQHRSLGQISRGALSGSGAMRGLGRSLAFASGTFLGAAGLTAVLHQSVSAFSNLNEQTTKTQQVFGDASGAVISFSKNALGQAQDQALETASSIGALLRPLGVLPDEAARTSITLTKLGTDLASFYNTDVSDALAAIQSGLVGEVEPLRRYGTVLSETRVQQLALAQSGKENVKALTNEEKVRARVAIILRDTAQAQGDYARTQGGLANQQRDLEKNVRNLEIALGRVLYPTVLKVTRRLNKWLGDSQNQKRVADDFATGVHGVGTAFEFAAEQVRVFNQDVRNIKGAIDAVRNVKVPGWLPGATNQTLFGRFAPNPGTLVGPVGGGDFGDGSRPDDRARGARVGGRGGFGTTGGGGGGGGGPKPRPDPGTGIPWLDNLLARDEATAGRGDDERDIRRAITVLRSRLSRAKSLAARTELQRALNQYADQLAQLEAQDQAEAQAKIDAAREKARTRRERLAEQRRRRQERLATQRRAAEQRRETAVERTVAGFDRRLALTEATPDNDDNLRILHDEMRFLRSQIKNTRLAQSFRDKLEGDYTALIRRENALRRAKKTPKIDTAGREQQAFIGELSGILGQFSSNVAGAAGSAPTGAVNHITINNPTPKSNFAMLREARLAAAHVF